MLRIAHSLARRSPRARSSKGTARENIRIEVERENIRAKRWSRDDAKGAITGKDREKEIEIDRQIEGERKRESVRVML